MNYKSNEIMADLPPPLWQKCTSYLLSFIMVGQIVLPGVASAAEVINDATITTNVNASPQFSRVYNRERQFEKAYYITSNQVETAQDLVSFHKTLLNDNKSGLPEPLMIPIAVGDITVIFPHYPVDKRIGDKFVQARLIRMQMQREIDRLILPKMSIYQSGANQIDPRTEKEQINYLYQNAKSFAANYSVKYGEKVTRQQVNTFAHDFIWPELRNINGEQVLVPVLHLTDSTINSAKIAGHTVEVSGDYANFRNITVNSGTLLTRRNAFLNATDNLSVGEHAKVIADEDLNLNVGGTLFNTGSLEASKGNVDIIAHQYGQKTMVHRYATKYEQGTRLGQIAQVSADGTISIQTSGDIKIRGSDMSANVIKLSAGGSIQIESQDTTYSRNEWVGGYHERESFLEHYGSKLEAKDSIFLMASGQVQIIASELIADEGVLSILASQGVHILNSFDQYQSSKSGKVGRTSLQESQFQSIAIRSALEAGKSVVIASDFGDINLKAVKLTSQEGANISAHSGKVNLLLAKEQDHFFQQKVHKNFWRVKTTTIDRQNDNAVYNSIVGGVNIHATKGLTLELGMRDNQTLDEVLDKFRKAPDLRWMAELYDDPEYRDNAELVYKKLVHINKKDTSRALGPGPMAMISIAVSIALSPAGGAAIGGLQGAMLAGLKAIEVSIVTSVISSVAAGNSLDDALEALTEKEYLRSIATSAITAGTLNYLQTQGLNFFEQGAGNSNSWDPAVLAQQAGDVVIQSAVSSGIQTIINGDGSKDFFDSWKKSAMHMATSKLGAKVANKIGSLTSEGRFNEAMRYVSHAALGCALGVATDEINDADDRKNACTSGAVGGVVGEAASFIYTDALLSDEQREMLNAMKELGLPYDVDMENLTAAQQEAARQKLEQLRYRPTSEDFENIKIIAGDSVNAAKLSAGLTAMLAGLDVNIAANTAENAAQNNFVPFVMLLVEVVSIAMTIYTVIETIQNLKDLAKNYHTITDAQKRAWLINSSKDLLIEMGLSRLGGKYLDFDAKSLQELKEQLYVLIKAHPDSNRLQLELQPAGAGGDFLDDLLEDHSGIEKPIMMAKLNDLAENFKRHDEYLENYPNSTITKDKVAEETKKGNILTENGRFANKDGKRINVPDDDNYKMTADKNRFSGDLYGDRTFKERVLDNPLYDSNDPGRYPKTVTVEQMVEIRKGITQDIKSSTLNRQRANALKQQARDLSEALGEARAMHTVENYCQDCKVTMMRSNYDYVSNAKNNQYDFIAKVERPDGSLEVVRIEAKGGAGSYGHAVVGADDRGNVVHAQQGSEEYMGRTDNEMRKRFDSDSRNSNLDSKAREGVRELGDTLALMDNPNVKQSYIAVEQRFDAQENLNDAAIRFFQ
ncbi:DUF637 domain-containing protein [Vibrio sp. AND4]|uniref:DUF637 domain-containing protein n=1 Tax=Vibrio sp. AND4 TaxID=314289 RepID=UPI00015EFBC2|nr:DUF637 domain-containing protein [Vibrio sp. AND4]EDP60236.1 histidine ammonia-lyase [Vibrio sp. AND4]